MGGAGAGLGLTEELAPKIKLLRRAGGGSGDQGQGHGAALIRIAAAGRFRTGGARLQAMVTDRARKRK
jgi:hypothetical protein